MSRQPADSPPGRTDRRIVLAKRRRGRADRDRFEPVNCPSCGRFLADVLPGASVFCRPCRLWVPTASGEVAV